MQKIKRCIGLLLLSLVLAVTPCNVSIPGIAPAIQAASSTVKISKTSTTLIRGQTVKLKITGTSSKVKWSSSKKSVATVNSNGKVTAKKKGTATITASVDGKKYTCKVKVITPSISDKELYLNVGCTYNLAISGTKKTVTWKSSNKKVATVNKKGKVTAKGIGATTITATVLGKKYKCVVTVTKATSSTVYVTETGKKYHRAGCRYLSESQIEIDLQAAINAGYTPCSVCNP
ncbi:MAG: Ig-like domain-containing protein [Lachnospiraceae bacterium]|nr:Ig-like domain-containing protein [Lachnospiraceae bacterium]